MEERLIQLKYPQTLIKDAIAKANISNRDQERNNVKILPFIQDFNKNNPKIFDKVIKPIASGLSLLDSLKNIKFLSAFRQPPSIISLLRKNNRKTIHGVRKCHEPRCKCCDIMICGSSLEFETLGNKKIFHIKSNLDCCSTNVIYKLICVGCNAYYIGQTGDALRNRVTVHRQQIAHRHYSFLNVSQHIRQCGGSFKIAPFFGMPPDSNRLQREAKESYFISLFHPPLNSFWFLFLIWFPFLNFHNLKFYICEYTFISCALKSWFISEMHRHL